MTSIVLRTATRYLLPLLILFSVFLLLRGHDEPGGGFAGGLVAAAGLVLHALAFGAAATRRLLRVDPRTLVGGGLALAIGSGAVALVQGRPILAGSWGEVSIPPLGPVDLGTPLLFDGGVYLLVAGVALVVVLRLAEE